VSALINAGGRLAFPLSRLGLQGEGLEGLVSQLAALNALTRDGAVAVVTAVLAERGSQPMPPELVWTGPEARQSGARDTAVVLAELFGRARSRVLLAGFAFDHASEVLRPLSEALRRGVTCRLYADAGVAGEFIKEHWPFGPPFPDVFGFVPEEGVFASLHAKCVVVDGRRARDCRWCMWRRGTWLRCRWSRGWMDIGWSTSTRDCGASRSGRIRWRWWPKRSPHECRGAGCFRLRLAERSGDVLRG
jgi:hypothetical protein